MLVELSFVPIVRRDLKYVSPTKSFDLVLAMSAPYRPPKTPFAEGKAAACMVQTYADPGLAIEIGGDDELEALEMGLMCLEKFIQALSADDTSKLLNQDGTEFVANNVSLMAYFQERLKSGEQKSS
jgi:hypothetical protein